MQNYLSEMNEKVAISTGFCVHLKSDLNAVSQTSSVIETMLHLVRRMGTAILEQRNTGLGINQGI